MLVTDDGKRLALQQCGFALLEVLVTIIILAFGLLGLAGLQSRALSAELESYQRAQALILTQDMADKMQTNRKAASGYAFTTSGAQYVGTSASYDCTAITDSRAQSDCTDWGNLLLGAAETIGTSKVGAMIGARGCVSYDSSTELTGLPGSGVYTVTVAWQGMGSLTAPPAAVTCAASTYKNSSGTADDTYRRAVTVQFRIGSLT